MTCQCPTCGRPIERIDPQRAIETMPLGPRERAVLAYMARRFGQALTARELIDVMVADDVDGGPMSAPAVLSVVIWRVRPKLAPFGLAIESFMGRGGSRRLTWAKPA